MPDYPAIARTLTDALKLGQPPIAVCLHVGDTVPAGVATQAPRVAAGCVFWEKAARGGFATSAADHANCAIGTFTHNLDTTEAHEVDRRISELAKANEVLTSFHALRRRDIEAGGHPTIQESLTRLHAQKS